MGTIGPAGTPQSSLVGIAVTDTLEIIFDSVMDSRKYANLVLTPACSFAIGWTGEKTVQYEGRASVLTANELARGKSVYFQVWPDGPGRQNWAGIVYFRIQPAWIRYSDFGTAAPSIHAFTFD